MSRGSRVRTIPWLAGLGALVVLGGCGVGTRGGVATNNVSACSAVLPLARQAVHGHGRLVRIHRLRHGEAATLARALGHPIAGPHPQPTTGRRARQPPRREPKRCLIVYRGPYRRGDLAGARGQRGGYAVMIATARHPKIIQTILTDRLPPRVRR
jgi:hypothetical protein